MITREEFIEHLDLAAELIRLDFDAYGNSLLRDMMAERLWWDTPFAGDSDEEKALHAFMQELSALGWFEETDNKLVLTREVEDHFKFFFVTEL